MAVESVSPEAAYATKDNIVHPGSPEQAAAAAEKAQADLTEAIGPEGVAVVVDPVAVPVSAEHRVIQAEPEVDESVPTTQQTPPAAAPVAEAEVEPTNDEE